MVYLLLLKRVINKQPKGVEYHNNSTHNRHQEQFLYTVAHIKQAL